MSSPPIIVVMALDIEGQGVFEAAGVDVLYTGVGKVNAAHALTRRLTGMQREGGAQAVVLNLGTAGSARFGVSSLVACRGFVQRDIDASPLGFEPGVTPFDSLPTTLTFQTVFPHLPHGICGSGDSFEIAASDPRCDVYDMEAYALARVCALQGVDFACVKYITDGADAEAAQSWQTNLVRASREWLHLYEHVREWAAGRS